LETVIDIGLVVSKENQPSGPDTERISPIVTKARATGEPSPSITRPDTWKTGTVVVVVGGRVVVGAAVLVVVDGDDGVVVVDASMLTPPPPGSPVQATTKRRTAIALPRRISFPRRQSRRKTMTVMVKRSRRVSMIPQRVRRATAMRMAP
jgi:hypothetical protein